MSDHQHDTSTRDPGATSTAPDDRTTVRHIRVGLADWRRAASRAAADGYGVAELVRELVRAYGAGEIDAPNRTDVRPHPADRTSVRPPPRESNGRSIAPPAGPVLAPARATTTDHHQPTPTAEERP